MKNILESRTLALIDEGHGIDTAGKRSPLWPNGTQLFEWDFNREVGSYLSRYLTASNISNIKIVEDNTDMPLAKRTDRINELYLKYKKDYFVYTVSIHGNAYKDSKVSGIEVFTTTGLTVCDTLADMTMEELAKLGWNMRPGNDGQLNKELNYWILRKTMCPAFLSETGFYTNYEQCQLMLDPRWRHRIAMAHLRAMVRIEMDKGIIYDKDDYRV